MRDLILWLAALVMGLMWIGVGVSRAETFDFHVRRPEGATHFRVCVGDFCGAPDPAFCDGDDLCTVRITLPRVARVYGLELDDRGEVVERSPSSQSAILEAGRVDPVCKADIDGDGQVLTSDATKFIGYFFSRGSAVCAAPIPIKDGR